MIAEIDPILGQIWPAYKYLKLTRCVNDARIYIEKPPD